MRSTSISAAKNNLSALIKEVQAGKTVIITDRGVPVAKLLPVRLGKGVPPRVLGLAHQGLAQLPERAPSLDWLDLPMPKLKAGPSVVDLIVEERHRDR